MASNPAPRWQRLEHDERRRQILVVARRLFSERSYAAVSTSDIAREAGVARGLLHHYFGTKRELYLEVVRAFVRMPSNPVPVPSDGGLEVVIGESVDRWLEMLERNRGTWLAAVGAQGLGRDVEVEAILDDAREQAVDRLIVALEPYEAAGASPELRANEAAEASPELRAVLRAYSGLAESASLEWLLRDRLTREQVQTLLVRSFLALVREVLPAVEAAARVTRPSHR